MEPATNLRVLSWKQHTGKGAVGGFLSEKAEKVASQLFFLVGKKTMICTLKKKKTGRNNNKSVHLSSSFSFSFLSEYRFLYSLCCPVRFQTQRATQPHSHSRSAPGPSVLVLFSRTSESSDNMVSYKPC